MLIINLFGTPSSGKSTGAAYIFSKLKLMNINAELVKEFAKEKAWENNTVALENQAYIFGNQFYSIYRLEGKVDVAITDSPLALSILYNQLYNAIPILDDSFHKMVADVFKSYASLNYLLIRDKPYNPRGRVQNEQESDALLTPLRELLHDYNIEHTELRGNVRSYYKIVEDIMLWIGGNSNG